jgi:UDP-N-acetylglucosamine 1-carboxyvinyltransferase
MSSFLVKGLSGQKTLTGVLPVMGAKNSILKAQACSLLFKNDVLLHNAPLIEDVIRMNTVLEGLGSNVEQVSKRSFSLKAPKSLKTDIDKDIAKLLRSSVVLTGPILAREGRVSFPHPGGCVIGERSIDVFLDAFQKMGAHLKEDNDVYVLEAKKLRGTEIFLKVPSVTVTETLMMTAVLVNGITVLHNCACEPEVVCLAQFLNSAGANVSGAGTHTIIIQGSGELLDKGVFNTPPDRIEAGSFIIISALCGKDLKITNCNPDDMRAVLFALKKIGVNVKKDKDYISVSSDSKLKPLDIKTSEYPGFPTDLQAPLSVLLTQAQGRSLIFETVFEGRLNYATDLKRMGADIVICDPHRAMVTGPTSLRGREVESPDLRAGLAFLIAALMASGDSVVNNTYNIDRGYEKIEDRLNTVGAEIKRIKK